MVVAFLSCLKGCVASPADVPLAAHTSNMVASTIFLYCCAARAAPFAIARLLFDPRINTFWEIFDFGHFTGHSIVVLGFASSTNGKPANTAINGIAMVRSFEYHRTVGGDAERKTIGIPGN